MTLIQPSGVFPLAVERVRPGGERQVFWVKSASDGGEAKGAGKMVTQIPGGGFVFVPKGAVAMLKGFDANGREFFSFGKPGFEGVGRPSVDGGGNFVYAEFYGDGESEIWRIPLRGKGPAMQISVVRGNPGLVNPAATMDGSALWMNFGGQWNYFGLRDSMTERVNVKPLLDGLPSGTKVVEIRPSPSIPKQMAVAVELNNATKSRWVMVWNWQTNLVSRVSPVGSDSFQVDWSRDGRNVMFQSRNVETGRIALQSVSPSGGQIVELAVIEDAKEGG